MLYHSEKQLEPFEGEIFMPYPDNEQYLVSNYGRILSKEQRVNHNYGACAVKKARILTQTKSQKGYFACGLTFKGKTKTLMVSRIVAQTFIPNPENKPQVNHINGIKIDNRVVNLEWNTSGENVMHAWNNGLAQKQKSFLYVKERLEKINPYISNRLRVSTPIGIGTVIIDQSCYRIEYDNGRIENLVKSIRFWQDEFKIYVRNLSDLTKEIEVNGERFVPIDRLKDIYNSIPDCFIQKLEYHNLHSQFTLFGLEENESYEVSMPLCIYEKLYEWHFAIDIPEHLYIDINTITNG